MSPASDAPAVAVRELRKSYGTLEAVRVLGIIENRGDLTVKKAYHVGIKKDRPPMVQAQPEKKAEAAVGVKQPAKTKKEKQAGAEV